ncbi:DUF1311 domain-containing protein [Deinococcus psychrotolerans]|uniref:DUF1311 domain-containing protein n=1 Tax=Deinococcus psychrotolerans TaxID=2489213 RepID=A0A3G8Y9Y1_9DEIO|nr:lysozyme inhibitor LprI family protein [Deinococcus psychrotolerans]AZI42168.1 DUF1311 domain-containing protein [Deinococcus psychrotolerans]
MKLTAQSFLSPVVLSATLILSLPAFAQTDVCKSETISDMQKCADQNLKQSEKALNAEYQQLVATLSDKKATDMLKNLQAAENLWIRTRTADCKLYKTFYKGGSLADVSVTNCMDAAAKQRLTVLQSFKDEFSR